MDFIFNLMPTVIVLFAIALVVFFGIAACWHDWRAKRKASRLIRPMFILAACLLCVGARAQIATNSIPTSPPNPASLPGTILGYFTAFNTNLDTCWKDNSFDLWAGASSIQNATHPLVNDIFGSYDLWRPVPANTNSGSFTAISLEAGVRNEGMAGAIVSGQGGVGFSVIVHDTKATLYLDGGSYFGTSTERAKYFGEVGIRVKKAFGAHFYGGVGLGAQFGTSVTAQVFSAMAGATF